MIIDVVNHYTATYDDQDIGRAEIDAMHKARGWKGIGYHYVIRLDGTIEIGRKESELGAHVRGKNSGKLGVTVAGGLRQETGGNVGVDTRTPAQITSQIDLLTDIMNRHPAVRIPSGHRDHVSTQCPGYDVKSWWAAVKGQRVPIKPTDSLLPGTRLAPEPISTPVVTRGYLKRGSRGTEVRSLQTALQLLGFYPKTAKVDGIFGRITEQAVKDFQQSVGIVVDGKVGPVTWAKLFEAGGIK